MNQVSCGNNCSVWYFFPFDHFSNNIYCLIQKCLVLFVCITSSLSLFPSQVLLEVCKWVWWALAEWHLHPDWWSSCFETAHRWPILNHIQYTFLYEMLRQLDRQLDEIILGTQLHQIISTKRLLNFLLSLLVFAADVDYIRRLLSRHLFLFIKYKRTD